MNTDIKFKLHCITFNLLDHFTPDTEGAVTRECLRRLVKLGLPPKAILGFLRGNVWVSESPSGKLRPPTMFDAKYIKSVEKACDCKIYLIIRDYESEERPIYFLSVDRCRLFWRSERKYLIPSTADDGWGDCPAVQMTHYEMDELQKCEIMIVKAGKGLELVKLWGSPVSWYDSADEDDEYET